MESETIIPNKTASRKRRFAAAFIDQVIYVFIMALLALLVFRGEIEFPKEGDSGGYLVLAFFVVIPAMIIYFMRDFYRGISPGKWIFGIKVVTNDEEELVPKKSELLARNLTMIIWPIEFIVLSVSKDKRRWGDSLANAKVVYNGNKAGKSQRIIGLAMVLLGLILSLYTMSTLVIRNSDAYQQATVIILNNDDLQKATGGIEGFGAFPAGQVSMTNGEGKADLLINTIGKDKNLNVKILLEKAPNDTLWVSKAISWE